MKLANENGREHGEHITIACVWGNDNDVLAFHLGHCLGRLLTSPAENAWEYFNQLCVRETAARLPCAADFYKLNLFIWFDN